MKLTATLDDLLRDLPKILAAGVEVTEVEVSDKEPHQTGFEGMAWYDEGFSWDDERDERQDVPTAVFSNLPPCDEEAPAKFYPTEAEARKALSDAVIAWARQQNQQQQ